MTGNAFATFDDFVAFHQLDEDDVAEATVDLLLELASGLIRAEVRQQLAPVVEADEVVLEGRGLRTLQLPELPVLAVTTVTEELDGTATELVEGTDYRVELGRGGRIGQLHRLGQLWPAGGTVTVVYDHGYTLPASSAIAGSLPVAVKAVALRVVGRGYANPEELRQESAGGSSATFASDRPGLYLTAADREDLAEVYPGGAGGAR